MSLNSPYDRYIAWNRALIDYYFDDNDIQQVFLCVDEGIIEDVGRKSRDISADVKCNGQTYLEHFLKYTCPARENRKGFPPSIRTNSLNVLIKEMVDYSAATTYFFAFTIMLVYLYTQGGTERAISSRTEELCGDRFTRFNTIVEMWDILGKRYKRFGADRLAGSQPFVGRLKFHTVLKRRFKDAFLSILIENNLKWNEEEESLEQFINYKIGPLLLENKELLGVVKDHINNPDTLFYFESLVRNCNYNQARTQNKKYKRTLLFVYNARGGQLYLKIEGEDSAYLYSDKGDLKPYLLDDIFYANKASVHYQPYDNVELDMSDNENNVVYSTTNRRYRLLKKVDDCIYEEVMEAEDGHSYLFITNSKSSIGTIDNQSSTDITNKVSAFGQGVRVLSIKKWHGSQTLESECENQIVSSSYPKLRGGLWSTTETGAYIPSALPIIEFEDDEYASQAEIVCNQYPMLCHGVEITSKISGRYAFLTLTGKASAAKTEWEVSIKRRGGRNADLTRNIQIHHKLPDIQAPQYGIDRFGVERPAGQLALMPQSLSTNGQQLQQGNKKATNISPLLDILIQLSNHGIVSQANLKKAISYTLRTKGLENTSYNRIKVINALSDLGYIIGYKNNSTSKYENQLCQPKLHRTQIKLNHRYIPNAYMLTGCYSSELLNSLKRQIEEIKTIVENRSETTPSPFIDTSCIHYRPVSECIPDIVLLQPADINLFKEKCEIDIIDHPYAFDLIRYAATIEDCISKYLLNNEDRKPYNEAFTEPWIKYGDSYKSLIWKKGKNEIYETDHYSDHEDLHMRKEVPLEFMKNYTQMKKGKAVAILEPNVLNNTILRNDHNFNSITFTSYMGVPKILKRALCELNQGCPVTRKSFIVNAAESNITSNYIYTECETYSIKTRATDIVRVLTGTDVNDWNNTDLVFITQRIRNVKLELRTPTDFDSKWYILKLTKGNYNERIFFELGTREENDTCVRSADGQDRRMNVTRSGFNEFLSKLILSENIDNYVAGIYTQELTVYEDNYEELVIFYKR